MTSYYKPTYAGTYSYSFPVREGAYRTPRDITDSDQSEDERPYSRNSTPKPYRSSCYSSPRPRTTLYGSEDESDSDSDRWTETPKPTLFRIVTEQRGEGPLSPPITAERDGVVMIPSPCDVPHDSRLAGYTLFFGLVSFILLHILPLIDAFPVLLRARMGTTAAMICTMTISGFSGFQVALTRRGLWSWGERMTRHRTFGGWRRLGGLGCGLYLSSYTTPWLFEILYEVQRRVPFVGKLLVVNFIGGCSVVLWIVTVSRSGKLAYSLTNSGYGYLFTNKQSLKRKPSSMHIESVRSRKKLVVI